MTDTDREYRSFGAALLKQDGPDAPYNPFVKDNKGDPDDTARYIQEPGVNFMRPWIAIRNGAAFQWPLGMEGFSVSVDPTLGIHKYIGDNKVAVDVVHAGEEHFTLSGNFPGSSGPDMVKALRDIVYKDSSAEGKLLWLPEVVTYVQRVQVANFSSSRDESARGKDLIYSIEFVRLGTVDLVADPNPVPAHPQPTHPPKGKTSRTVKVDATHNTLRKIALWKLKSAAKWRTIYDANQKWFVDHKVPLAKAPDYRLPIGLAIHY